MKNIEKALIGICISALLTSSASSQSDRDEKNSLKEEATQAMNLTIPQTNKVLLEESINPAEYILGPGDILSIFTWGNFQGQFQMPITPEGMLLVPEVGPVEVAGISLDKAATEIKRNILKRYRNVETIVSLVELRRFKVYVGGGVIKPGAYPATAVSRVSEIIDMAGGFWGYDEEISNSDFKHEFSDEDEQLASKRNISIYRQNGDTLKADILRFEISGHTNYNPTLIDGDRIFVALKEMRVNLYGIFGAVRNPGYFEYSDVDMLSDLLDLGHGLRLDADSSNIEIVRFKEDNETTRSFNVDLTSDEWDLKLRADDRVYVKEIQNYHSKHQVKLTGEFIFPGFYAIHPNTTYLSEILEKADGFTEEASLDEAEMVRVSAEELEDPEFERLQKMLVADMTDSEYDYFKIKSRSKPGRVSVNLNEIINNAGLEKDIILRDGDVINIPKKSKVVTVIGEVANPGIMTYSLGKDYRYYINTAGGFSDRARGSGISVIKGITGEWQKPKKGKTLDPGDTVWVPEKKKRDYWGFIKDSLIFIGNLATVYLVIDQATK